MSKHTLKILSVCLLVVLSGCMPLPDGSQDTSVHVDLSPVPKQTADGFQYNGQIGLDSFGSGCIRDLQVTLYTANLTKIESVSVGTLCYTNESPGSRNITIATTKQPAYIIMESPDFWDEDAGPSPTGYVLTQADDYYRQYPITRKGQIKPDGDVGNPLTTNTTSNSLHATPLPTATL